MQLLRYSDFKWHFSRELTEMVSCVSPFSLSLSLFHCSSLSLSLSHCSSLSLSLSISLLRTELAKRGSIFLGGWFMINNQHLLCEEAVAVGDLLISARGHNTCMLISRLIH